MPEHNTDNLNTSPVEKKKHPTVKDKNKEILAYLHDVVYLLAGVLLIFLLLFRIVTVDGASMNDTLLDGDYVLLLNNTFCGKPKQGDVVVISKKSFKDGSPIIKRVIATEGQEVIIKNGVVTVDGVVLQEDYLNPENVKRIKSPLHTVVEEGHVFCLGDNRDVSLDSSSPLIGQIDCREIIGKAIINFLPRSSDGKSFDFSRFGGIN